MVDGEDITDTWSRRPDEYNFEIEDVIAAQEFVRNKETGVLEAWKDGEKICDVVTMGDQIDERSES